MLKKKTMTFHYEKAERYENDCKFGIDNSEKKI